MKNKSILKQLIIAGAVLALLFGGGIALVVLIFPTDKVVALILSQAEKTTGRRITLEKAGFTFFPRPGITLSGLSVENTTRANFSRAPFLTVEKFTAGISIASLFKASPEITRIVLKKPVLRIEISEQGTINADDLAPRDSALRQQLPPGIPVLPIPITLQKLVIESGTLIYDDRKTGIQTTVGTFDQEARIVIDPSLQNIASDGTLRLSDISVKAGEFRAPLAGLVVTLTHDIGADLPAGTVTVNRINVSCGKIVCAVTGTMKDVLTSAPMLDLTLSAPMVNAADLLVLVPASIMPFVPGLSASGSITFGARLQGRMLPGMPPLFSGSVKLSDVAVKYAGFPQSINKLNAEIEFADKSITVNPLTMRLGTSPVEITAVVTNLRKRFFDATVKAAIDLDEIKDIVPLPQGVALGGKVVADIRADDVIDPADPGMLSCTGRVDLRQVSLLWPPLARGATINGTLTLAKEDAAARFTAAVDQSSLEADATVTHFLYLAAPLGTKCKKRPVIECKITSPLLDLDKMLNLPLPPQARKGTSAAAEPDLLLPMPLPGVDLHATLSAKRIVYKGFAMRGVESKIASVNDSADMTFASSFSTGAIDNAVHADFRNQRTFAFSDKFTVKNVELNDLMARFGNLVKPVTPLNKQLAQLDKGLSGRITVQGALQGAGDTPDRITNSLTGAMTVRMADGKLENTPVQKTAAAALAAFLKSDKFAGINPITFKELSASVRIASRRAYIDELQIMSDLGDWKARGSIGFDAYMDMAVSTRLSKQASGKILALEGGVKGAAKSLLAGTQLASAAGLLDNLSLIPHDNEGRISLKFALMGPVDEPKVGSLDFGEVGREKGVGSQAVSRNAAQRKNDVQEEMIRKAGEQIKNTLRGLFQ